MKIMKVTPLEEFHCTVRTMQGKTERATFMGNPAGVAVRKWCKTCREYTPGLNKYSCMLAKDIGDGRSACGAWSMHPCFMILAGQDARLGRIKTKEYLAFVADNANRLAVEYARLPDDVRNETTFITFMRNRYKMQTGLNVYKNEFGDGK